MITGIVAASREAMVALVVRGPRGQEERIQAVIDSGFTGVLTLPSATIATLGLTWRGRSRGTLADGATSRFDVYEATVVWDGRARRVPVAAMSSVPLVGMALLDGYRLTIDAAIGGSVSITALPNP